MPLRRHEDGCIETGDAIVERCAGNAAVVDVHEPRTGGVGELGRVVVPRLPRREIGVDEHAQLARCDRLLRTAGGRNGDERLGPEQPEVQPVVARPGPGDGRVEAAVEDARDLNVARHDPFVDADVERRRLGELLGKPTDVADTQRTCRSRESALRSCGEFEDLACVGQQHPPGRGQFNVSSISYKQRRAEARLERLDLLRERRCRDVQTFGCSGEVKLLGNGDEVAK